MTIHFLNKNKMEPGVQVIRLLNIGDINSPGIGIIASHTKIQCARLFRRFRTLTIITDVQRKEDLLVSPNFCQRWWVVGGSRQFRLDLTKLPESTN